MRTLEINPAFYMILMLSMPIATADDIGHGQPGSGAEAEPAEESEPSESSTDSFFNELLAIFELESSD